MFHSPCLTLPWMCPCFKIVIKAVISDDEELVTLMVLVNNVLDRMRSLITEVFSV